MAQTDRRMQETEPRCYDGTQSRGGGEKANQAALKLFTNQRATKKT